MYNKQFLVAENAAKINDWEPKIRDYNFPIVSKA